MSGSNESTGKMVRLHRVRSGAWGKRWRERSRGQEAYILKSVDNCKGLASRWKEDMAFLRSFYVADDIWRFA